MDVKELDKLLERSSLFNKSKRYDALFSKSGFTEKFMEQAKLNGILLFSIEDLFIVT